MLPVSLEDKTFSREGTPLEGASAGRESPRAGTTGSLPAAAPASALVLPQRVLGHQVSARGASDPSPLGTALALGLFRQLGLFHAPPDTRRKFAVSQLSSHLH